MKLLDGKEVAAFHRSRIERRIAELQKGHIQPKLVILLAISSASCTAASY